MPSGPRHTLGPAGSAAARADAPPRILDTLREVPRGGDLGHAGTAQAPVRRHRLAGGSRIRLLASGMSAGAVLPGPAIPILSQGKRPDIFVVNSFGSGFQALFVFLLLPVLSNLWGIKFAELPAYLNGGTECFLNVGESPIDCGGAPFLPLLFMLVNMAFNISLLNLVKMSSALVASLTSTSASSFFGLSRYIDQSEGVSP